MENHRVAELFEVAFHAGQVELESFLEKDYDKVTEYAAIRKKNIAEILQEMIGASSTEYVVYLEKLHKQQEELLSVGQKEKTEIHSQLQDQKTKKAGLSGYSNALGYQRKIQTSSIHKQS